MCPNSKSKRYGVPEVMYEVNYHGSNLRHAGVARIYTKTSPQPSCATNTHTCNWHLPLLQNSTKPSHPFSSHQRGLRLVLRLDRVAIWKAGDVRRESTTTTIVSEQI